MKRLLRSNIEDIERIPKNQDRNIIMVLEYIPTYRLSQERLKSHLEEVFGYIIITFYVSDTYHSHTDTAPLVS